MHQIVRLILYHFYLFADHLSLFCHLPAVEYSIADHIYYDVGSVHEMRTYSLYIITGSLFSCKSVHLAAYLIHIFCYLSGISLLSSLKHHVFDEVGYAGDLWRLVHRSVSDPYAYGSRLDMIKFFHDYSYAAVQYSYINIAHSFPSKKFQFI